MNSSRQLLLGTGVFLGGSLLLYAMTQQSDSAPADTTPSHSIAVNQVDQQGGDVNMLQPLTADIKTEERILAEKRRARELKVAELDKRTREFLVEQDRAEVLAMDKARLENEKYRNNAIEPTNDVPLESTSSKNNTNTSNTIAKPVVTDRDFEPETVKAVQPSSTLPPVTVNKPKQVTTPVPKTEIKVKSDTKATPKPVSSQPPSTTQVYKVKRGEGLIKIARQNNVPLEALLQANKLSTNSNLHVGEALNIPAGSQINRLVREYNAKSGTTNKQVVAVTAPKPKPVVTAKKTPEASAPTSPSSYEVKRGDGLIKLARQYNIPVEALAEVNNLRTTTSLRVGQNLTIPSRRQIARLKREAAQREQAAETKLQAQQRLVAARRKASQGESKGTFGVQVALADNQNKADEIVKKLRAAGYPAATSTTSRGVRVIVGPEKGKEAALALKDKINADAKVDVNNAWVLYWR